MVMRVSCLVFLFTVIALPRLGAQAASDSANKGSIQGTVVDSKTGQPLKGAEVSLRSFSAGGRGDASASVSDGEGRFTFDGLAAGRYRLTASKNGYLSRDPRSGAGLRSGMVNLSAGQHAEAALRMTPAAVLSGRVTTEGDEPLPNVFVQAMKFTYRNDKRQLTDVGTSTTNDRGEYRIWGLAPGKYYIRAAHPRVQAVRPGGQVYVPIFYPGVSDPSRTQAVDLHAGDELSGIDLNFVSLRSVRVSGRVLGASSQPVSSAQVSLVSGTGGMTFAAGEASTDSKGTFEIRGVPPGSYELIGEQFGNKGSDKVMRGRTPVEVGEVNVSDVEVIVGPGASVSGRVKIEGKTNPDFTKLSVALDAQDDLASMGFAPDVSNIPLQRDGTFAFHDVPEGTYRVNVTPLPSGYYLKPSGEGDAIDAGLRVGRNHAASVELTLSAGAGSVTGAVTKGDQPAASAVVVLVPDAPRRGQPRLYRQAMADAGGRFNIASVPPGDYKLFAWEEIERGMYLDQDFLQPFEDFGKSVRVEEGSNLDVPLELIQVSE
jgi:protocatechuate 3,4-dioxygenase beta subunit